MPSATWGLSPRVRGNLVDQLKAKLDNGSIPACAGEPIICAKRPRR